MSLTYEELVAECKKLRSRHERAEAEFLVFLLTAEREHREVWSAAGCATFEQFIRSNHLCETDRYRFFAIGVDRVGVDDAIAFGAHWTIQRGKMDQSPPKAIEEFTARAKAFVATEAVAPSDQTVREWRSQVAARTADHATVRRVDELSKLREENKRLKSELAAAKKRIAELEAQQAPSKRMKKKAA